LQSLCTYQTRGQPLHEQSYAITTQDCFIGKLPRSCETDHLSQSLREEENIWTGDVVLRANRELLEIHPIDNHCQRCGAQLTSCECRDFTKLTTSVLLEQIPEALHRLFYAEELAIVEVYGDGAMYITGRRDRTVEKHFAPYAPGIGFQTYVRNYHLRGPD